MGQWSNGPMGPWVNGSIGVCCELVVVSLLVSPLIKTLWGGQISGSVWAEMVAMYDVCFPKHLRSVYS